MLSNRENNPVCWSCLFPCRQICPGSLIMVRRLVSKEGMGAGGVSWRPWEPGCNCSKLASPLQGCSPMWWGISVSESVSTLGTTVLETCSQYLFLLWFSLFWDPIADHFFVLIQANLTVHYPDFDPPSDDLIPSWEQPNFPVSKFLGARLLGCPRVTCTSHWQDRTEDARWVIAGAQARWWCHHRERVSPLADRGAWRWPTHVKALWASQTSQRRHLAAFWIFRPTAQEESRSEEEAGFGLGST